MKILHIFFTVGFVVFTIFAPIFNVSAYTIEKLNFENKGDIVVGPGKKELSLSPGETVNQEIIISNRSGLQKIINISVEDFQGSNNPDEAIKLLGNNRGPFSLKDYISPEINQITLNFGERIRIPINISIPESASPGGLYGAVIISAENVDDNNNDQQEDSAAGRVKIITQVASLFFIKIKGDVVNEGNLVNFEVNKNIYESGPIDFKILSENKGSVYLSPYGTIEIKNIIGQKIDTREIDPWFVMPASIRERVIKWNSNFLFGRYTATLSMNRGYNDIIDTKTISFWVIPWRIILILLIGLVLVVWFLIWIFSHLQWKGKK